MGMSRSDQMARIKGRHTTPERTLRSMLWSKGLRYRVHGRTPVGRPDIVFPSTRIAVFIDGCFWHGCPMHYVRPRTRDAFWAEKLFANVERDRRQTLQLEQEGWRVLRFWEHQVEEEIKAVLDEIAAAASGGCGPALPGWRVCRVDALESRGEERRYLVDLRDSALWCAEEGPRYSRSGPKDVAAIRLLEGGSSRLHPMLGEQRRS